MKKVFIIIICFFLFTSFGFALTLTCPEVASAGEIITCNISESELIGIKGRYGVDPELSYAEFKSNSNWKMYYVGSNGFSIGNVLDKSMFQGTISFKIGMNAVVGKEYVVRLLDVEGVNEKYENVVLGDVVSNPIRMVSDISTLKELKIDKGVLSPKFSPDVTSYQAMVDASSIVILASLTDEASKLEGDIGEHKLNYGLNVFKIKVTSARGSVREYQLYVTREVKSKDTSLKSLKVNGKKVLLEKEKFLYELEVDYSVLDLEIEAIANDKKAKVIIEKPEELVVGENRIVIKVIAEDGTECSYVLLVQRKRLLSKENRILSLLIDGYDLSFDKDKLEYSLKIDTEEKLNIEVILMDELSKYQIFGNHKLKDGSKIKIVVKAENGDELIYTIKIIQERDGNSSSVIDIIRVFPLVIFIILIVGILIVKLFKNKVKTQD